jgi:hypothetical protein
MVVPPLDLSSVLCWLACLPSYEAWFIEVMMNSLMRGAFTERSAGAISPALAKDKPLGARGHV